MFTVENGHAAIQMVQQMEMDVVTLDLKMPGISGIDTLKEIRAIDPDVMVIIITGFGSLQTAIEAIRYGVFDYIPKPFNVPEIMSIIDRSVQRRKINVRIKEFLGSFSVRTSPDPGRTPTLLSRTGSRESRISNGMTWTLRPSELSRIRQGSGLHTRGKGSLHFRTFRTRFVLLRFPRNSPCHRRIEVKFKSLPISTISGRWGSATDSSKEGDLELDGLGDHQTAYEEIRRASESPETRPEHPGVHPAPSRTLRRNGLP